MIKKLIPAAVLLSLFGAAQAEVSIYGLVDVSYGKNEIGFPEQTNATFHSGGDDLSSQGNSATKVGLKGSTEVSKGIKANFKLESNGIASDGSISGAFFNRAAWAGLSGNFGEVRLGRQDSVPFQTMIDFDFNGAANAASAQGNAGVATWGPSRQSRSLQYIAPAMGAVSIQAGFVPQAADPVATPNTKAVYSIGLKYSAGKLALAYAGQTADTNAGASFSSVAGSYDFGVAKVMVGYADAGTGAKGSTVGVVAPVAGFNVGLNYSKNSDTTAVATEFFVNREVFKNTTAYFDFGNKDLNSVKTNAYALGVIYAF